MKEIVGTIEKDVGHLIGSKELEEKGRATQRAGEVEQVLAKTGAQLQGAVEVLAGTAKDKLGKLTDNPKLQVEGRAEALEGHARQHANKL